MVNSKRHHAVPVGVAGTSNTPLTRVVMRIISDIGWKSFMAETPPLFSDIAGLALAAYGIKVYDMDFIRHGDNVTYKVDVPILGTHLLRIHVPVTIAMGLHGTDTHMINSELQWLEALCRDTDLVLQKPVRNQDGALVTQVFVEKMDFPINCTLLHWLNGQPYHRDLESEQTAYQIGEILAKLHNHASKWETPEGFTRPKRDIDYFADVLKGINPALDDGRIQSADYTEFEIFIALVNEMINALDENRQTYGIMHADAHKGNMLYIDGNIRLIDFSFCAFGNFMFDLGICLSDMKEYLHPSFLEGYQSFRTLPVNYQRLVEGFFVGSVVGTFSFWVANPQVQALLVKKAPQIARDYAAKFNRGEYFWFT
jgi:Ser/Thr protein kinase RdoA (MazF antagonist)